MDGRLLPSGLAHNMATIDDVEQGVCSALAAVVFPGQRYLAGQVAACSAPWIGSPGAPNISPQVRIGIGEPTSEEMERDLAAGISNVAIVHVAGAIRNCTFLRPRWIRTSCNAPTLLAALAADTVTFGGIAGAGMVVGVTADKVCYAYRCKADDTPFTVAAAFGAMIPAAITTGNVRAAPSIASVNIVADQQAFWCTGQREAEVQAIIIATPSAPGQGDGPLVRAALTRLVYGLEALTRPDGSLTRFIGLPDGTQAEISGLDERDDDSPDRNDMWKRTISFRLMYDTGVAQTQFTVLAPLLLAGTVATRLFWIGDGAPVSGVLTDGAGNVLGDAAGDMLGVL
jgi:hypothetical protein